jgi:hypothetical protein
MLSYVAGFWISLVSFMAYDVKIFNIKNVFKNFEFSPIRTSPSSIKPNLKDFNIFQNRISLDLEQVILEQRSFLSLFTDFVTSYGFPSQFSVFTHPLHITSFQNGVWSKVDSSDLMVFQTWNNLVFLSEQTFLWEREVVVWNTTWLISSWSFQPKILRNVITFSFLVCFLICGRESFCPFLLQHNHYFMWCSIKNLRNSTSVQLFIGKG